MNQDRGQPLRDTAITSTSTRPPTEFHRTINQDLPIQVQEITSTIPFCERCSIEIINRLLDINDN